MFLVPHYWRNALEHLGCDVKIASVRNFTTILKFWKPDVAVFTVWSAGPLIKNKS